MFSSLLLLLLLMQKAPLSVMSRIFSRITDSPWHSLGK
jgi:hypothetical protein